MIRVINFEIYRFDAGTDYLPYYKKVSMQEVARKESLRSVLEKAYKRLDAYGKSDFFRIEGRVISDIDVTIGETVDYFGSDLRIDPVSMKHAYKDLLMDSSDFMRSIRELSLITGFDQEDIKTANRLKYLNYVSDASKFVEGYLGDAIFLLVGELIKKYPLKRSELLGYISTSEGIMNFCGAKNQFFPENSSFDERIGELKSSVFSGYPLFSKEKNELRNAANNALCGNDAFQTLTRG